MMSRPPYFSTVSVEMSAESAADHIVEELEKRGFLG